MATLDAELITPPLPVEVLVVAKPAEITPNQTTTRPRVISDDARIVRK